MIKNNDQEKRDLKLLNFIKFLQDGMSIQIDHQYYCMSTEGRICVQCTNEIGEPIDCYCDIGEFNLDYLYKLIDKWKEEDYYADCGGHALFKYSI